MARPRKSKTAQPAAQEILVPQEEQPYAVPENWQWVRLGGVYTINPRTCLEDDSTLVSFVPMEKIEPRMTGAFSFDVRSWGEVKKGYTHFINGDVAFAKISPCFENGKSMLIQGLLNGFGAGTTELVILRQNNIYQKYTFYIISTENFIQKGVCSYKGTVGQQRINMDVIRNYPIPLPPLAEQERIVARIERLFSSLDKAREKVEGVIKRAAVRKAAILHKAFTGELTAQWREAHGDIYPYVKKKMKDVIADIKYGTSEKSDYHYTGSPVIRIPNIKDGYIDLSDIKFLHQETENDYDTLEENDILIIRSNGSKELIGKCALVRGEAIGKAYASFLIRLRLNNLIIPQYTIYMLQSPSIKKSLFKKAKSSVGINNINSKEICALELLLPQKTEQAEIVRILDELLEKERRVQEAAGRVVERIERIRQTILARAFRGELGTNDPTEPPSPLPE